MKYGICLQSFIPVRYSQTDKSEMISQLLFGETYTVIEKRINWLKIRCSYDNYTGWIDTMNAYRITEKSFIKINRLPRIILDSKVIKLTLEDRTCLAISPGSELPFYDAYSNSLKIDRKNFQLDGKPETGSEIASVDSVMVTAEKFLNVPYLWGGRSVFGTDCSGFTQIVFKINHIQLPRDTGQQVLSGKSVRRFENVWPGDLAFFSNKEGKICHVGIIMGDNKIIHASGQVRMDQIDSSGIFNTEKQNYSHHLECIRRVL